MTDRTIQVKLGEYSARKLVEMAKTAGMAPERLAEMMLESHFFEHDDFQWANGDPSDPLPALDVREPTYPWEDVKAEMIARLDRNRRRRA